MVGMTTLIALLSSGAGTWNHVASMMKTSTFERTILVTDEFGAKSFPEKFKDMENYDFVVVNFNKPVKLLISDIVRQLNEKARVFEAGVNFVSGSGKEHMALVAALIRCGIAFRLVAITQEGLEEL